MDTDIEDDGDDIWGDGAEREDSRQDADAIADFLKGWEWNARCAADQAATNAPLIEDCRPVMRAAFEHFLNDRGRWADDIIKAVDDGRRMNRLFDGDRFASDREDALLRLGWLMAYFHPKDNPLTEAQSKRARALGLFDDRDGSPRVKTDDEVVLGLGYLLRDLRSEESWPDSPGVLFPKHVGHAGAIAELKRWYKLVVGGEFAEAVDPSPPDSTTEDANVGSDGVIVSEDGKSVRWGKTEFTFTPNQARVVLALDNARTIGTRDVGQETLLQAVDHAAPPQRLRDVFRLRAGGKTTTHPAWGTMIVSGERKGTHRIANPPE